jgi:hypothetical protein
VLALLLLGEGVASVARRLVSGSAGILAWGSALVFLISAGAFLGLHGRAVFAFFRSVRVGALAIALYALSACLGVLFKQRDLYAPDRTEGFFQKFAYAQTYFAYHLLRPFGMGMPRVEVPPRAEEGLAWRAARYGKGAAEAQRKSMLASLSAEAKEKEIAAWMEAYTPELRRLYAFCEAVDLTRVWKSDWFATLNALLFTCVLSNAFRFGWGAWFTRRRFGFFLAHLGVLTVLSGSLAGRLFGTRGRVDLSTDPEHPRGIPNASRSFRPFSDPTRPREMPFTLRLEDFKAEYRTYLDVEFLDAEAAKHGRVKPPEFLVREGAELPLDFDEAGKPRIRIRVKEVHPRCEVLPDPVPADDPSAPAILAYEFRPASPEPGSVRWVLFADGPSSVFEHPEHAYRLRAVTAADASAIAGAVAEPVAETLGRLVVEVGEGEGAVREEGDARVDATVVARAAGNGDAPEVSATVLSYHPDPRLQRDPGTGRLVAGEDPTPLERRRPRNPALEVEVRSGDQTEKRWVFANFDIEAMAGQHRSLWKIPGIHLRFRFDRWASPVPARYLLLLREDGGLFLGKAGDPGSVREVRKGEPLPLAGAGEFLVRKVVSPRARIVPEIHPIPGAEFFHQDSAAAVFEIEGPEGTETVPLAALPYGEFSTHEYGERVRVHFYAGGAMPREWRSKLGCYDEKGESIAGGEIRVNDYLDVRGYKFFQENADSNDPTYSGIGVVYDPGIPLVLLGLYTIIAGAVYAFFLRPILLRKGAAP